MDHIAAHNRHDADMDSRVRHLQIHEVLQDISYPLFHCTFMNEEFMMDE